VHELATIATRLLAMATWIGKWRAKVSIGTMRTPPPTPSAEPRSPATNPMPPNAQRFSPRFSSFNSVVRHSSIGYCERSIKGYAVSKILAIRYYPEITGANLLLRVFEHTI